MHLLLTQADLYINKMTPGLTWCKGDHRAKEMLTSVSTRIEPETPLEERKWLQKHRMGVFADISC